MVNYIEAAGTAGPLEPAFVLGSGAWFCTTHKWCAKNVWRRGDEGGARKHADESEESCSLCLVLVGAQVLPPPFLVRGLERAHDPRSRRSRRRRRPHTHSLTHSLTHSP